MASRRLGSLVGESLKSGAVSRHERVNRLTRSLVGIFAPRLSAPPSAHEIAARFQNDPERYFGRAQGERMCWDLCFMPDGDAILDDIWVRVVGQQIAYAFGITLDQRQRDVRIGHFAVELEFVGMGIGSTLARALAATFEKRWAIDTITFNERSRKFDLYYPAFFERLGAVPCPKEGARAWRWRPHQTSTR